MQKEESISKEWLQVHTFKRCWTKTSNHLFIPVDIAAVDIIAFAVVQDGNMAGNYHRIFSYTSDGKRYVDIKHISLTTPLNKRYFNSGFNDWIVGTEVTDLRTNKIYQCVQVENVYFKCLELKNDFKNKF
jgi:hypothetical protein